MPLSVDEYKMHNATMFIPGEPRDFVTHDDFRRLCDDLATGKSKSLATNWPSRDWIDMIRGFLETKEIPNGLGTPNHKYYQTPSEAANFKHAVTKNYRMFGNDVCRHDAKNDKHTKLIARENAYDALCIAHISENNEHLCRDKTYERLVNLGFKDYASKTQTLAFIRTCRDPVCRQRQETAAIRTRRQNDDVDDGNNPESPRPKKARKSRAPPPPPVAPVALAFPPRISHAPLAQDVTPIPNVDVPPPPPSPTSYAALAPLLEYTRQMVPVAASPLPNYGGIPYQDPIPPPQQPQYPRVNFHRAQQDLGFAPDANYPLFTGPQPLPHQHYNLSPNPNPNNTQHGPSPTQSHHDLGIFSPAQMQFLEQTFWNPAPIPQQYDHWQPPFDDAHSRFNVDQPYSDVDQPLSGFGELPYNAGNATSFFDTN